MSTGRRCSALIGCLLAISLVGCQLSNKNQEAGTENAENAKAAGATSTSRPTSRRENGARPRPRVLTSTARTVSESLTIPAGTTLEARLIDEIDTGKTSEGATFHGSLATPLVVNGVEVAPVGSTVTGKVTNVVSSGRLSRPAELSLVLISFALKDGQEIQISTEPWSMKGESHKKRDIEMIGGGAGAGAVIGAITGGKKGAAIGSAIGAGAGTGAAAATGEKEIVLAPETRLTFRLSAPITLSMPQRG